MTDQEMRVAIAEACGWKEASRPVKDVPAATEYGWLTPDGKWLYPSKGGPPDYVNDLNAMHEAEKVLTPEQEVDYVERLGAALMVGAYEDDPRWVKSELSSHDSTYRATARQRAEAFLKTLGLWKK